MTNSWQCGRFGLLLGHPLIMGILNVTPDSFSDGGEHAESNAAFARGLALVEHGADIVDVGGESTRPGSAPVSAAQEVARVEPVVAELAAHGQFPVSIDTRHALVAAACVAAGASIINDVSGFRDPAMVDVAVGCEAGVVIMHMLGEPGTMQHDPRYDDVVDEVRGYLDRAASRLVAAGVARNRIAVDPGIGFGKTLEHNLELFRRLPELAELGYPLLVGASRKRFIGELTGVAEPRERVGGSVIAALTAVERGAHIVRVHDVSDTLQALRMAREFGDA